MLVGSDKEQVAALDRPGIKISYLIDLRLRDKHSTYPDVEIPEDDASLPDPPPVGHSKRT